MKVDDGHGGTVTTPEVNSFTDKKNEKSRAYRSESPYQ